MQPPGSGLGAAVVGATSPEARPTSVPGVAHFGSGEIPRLPHTQSMDTTQSATTPNFRTTEFGESSVRKFGSAFAYSLSAGMVVHVTPGTPAEAMSVLGLAPAVEGRTYTVRHSCPVNGDFIRSERRRVLLTQDGYYVGSYPVV